jgi:hypothetical protein
MGQRMALEMRPSVSSARQGRTHGIGSMFEQQFVEQLMVAFTPRIKELIKQVISVETAPPLVVDYEEAGRMIGISYEGIRKLVRKGKLTAVSRSGRYRGIAVQELKDYVERSQVMPGWSE